MLGRVNVSPTWDIISLWHGYRSIASHEQRTTCLGSIGFLDLAATSVLAACPLLVVLSPDVSEWVGTARLLLLVDHDECVPSRQSS